MNKQKLILDVKQNFMLKRIRAQEECEEFIANLRKNSEFNSLYSDLLFKQVECLKAEAKEEELKLRHDVEDLKIKIDNYLKHNGIDKSKLTPKYDCLICNDTGVAGGRICKCLQNELNYKRSMLASSQTEFKSFANSNLSIMNETDIKAHEWVKSWCLRFPNITKTNINIIGGAGTGKTFMLECIANELINKGCVISYKTAFELNELARQYHMGKNYDFADCMSVEVLLIDDLGTEPILKNVTKEYLYNLINVRQTNNKPTIISTNLSLDNILQRYDERIFSRLSNKNLSTNILLNSADKRLK